MLCRHFITHPCFGHETFTPSRILGIEHVRFPHFEHQKFPPSHILNMEHVTFPHFKQWTLCQPFVVSWQITLTPSIRCSPTNNLTSVDYSQMNTNLALGCYSLMNNYLPNLLFHKGHMANLDYFQTWFWALVNYQKTKNKIGGFGWTLVNPFILNLFWTSQTSQMHYSFLELRRFQKLH